MTFTYTYFFLCAYLSDDVFFPYLHGNFHKIYFYEYFPYDVTVEIMNLFYYEKLLIWIQKALNFYL